MPANSDLSDGIQGSIGTYNAILLALVIVALVIAGIVWLRRRR
jgi:LPXTG-motif cell wall-anchored protein